MLKLKRLYNHKAPRAKWMKRTRQCPTCHGDGVVLNERKTGVDPCPTCPRAVVTKAAPSDPRISQSDPQPRGTGLLVEEVPPVVGVEVQSAGDAQNFSTRLVEGGLSEGWLALGQGVITIGTGEDAVRYRILHGPGLFCCHCDEKLDDSVSAQGHVARLHAPRVSPDPGNPAGYRRDNFYAGERLGEG